MNSSISCMNTHGRGPLAWLPGYQARRILVPVILFTATLVNTSFSLADDNTLGMRFVEIPAGEYVRGFNSNNDADHRFSLAHPFSNPLISNSEKTSHRVEITQPFELAIAEVTVGQFRAFVEATGYATDAEKSAGALGWFPEAENYVDRFHKDPKITWKSPGFDQTDDHPVVGVSWNDAQAFSRWLSQKEEARYRLPTEAEWEYACRAGGTSWYSWGEDPDDAYTHANVADGALEAAYPNTTRFQRAVKLQADEGDGVVFTASVEKFKPNAWGLFDMHGNVWEWCQDRWADDAYERLIHDIPRRERAEFIVRDPVFKENTDQHEYGDWRVIRGGAWTCAPASVRCSIRTYAAADDAAIYTGFRLVREQ